jgi:hypothetical protein
MPVNDTTTNRGYQLPHATNNLDYDVARLRASFNAIDADIAGLLTSVAGKAATSHTHVISDVSGLQAALDGKLATNASISLDFLSDVNTAGAVTNQFLRLFNGQWVPVSLDGSMIETGTVPVARLPAHLATTALNSAYAALVHSHAIADVTGLQTALDAKVSGPASSVDRRMPLLSGTSGKVLIDSGIGMSAEGMPILPQSFGFRNRLINGDNRLDQQQGGAAVTIAALAADWPVDCWLAHNGGGATITAQRVTGFSGFPNAVRITGAAGNSYVSFLQRIEAAGIADLAGQQVVASVNMRASAARSVTIKLSYANAANNFASVTEIASVVWSITTTPGRYQAVFTLPAQAANGVQFEVLTGALGSGVWVELAGQQLEPGSLATPFDWRPIVIDDMMAKRFFEKGVFHWQGAVSAASGYVWDVPFKVTKFGIPTLGFSGGVTSNFAASSASNISAEKFSISANSTAAQANSFNILTWAARAGL